MSSALVFSRRVQAFGADDWFVLCAHALNANLQSGQEFQSVKFIRKRKALHRQRFSLARIFPTRGKYGRAQIFTFT